MFHATANRPFNPPKCAEQYPPEEPSCGPSLIAACHYDPARRVWVCECEPLVNEYDLRQRMAEHLIPACLVRRIWEKVRAVYE